jgi:hypothetical protein
MCGQSSKIDRVQQALDNAAEKKRDKLLRRGTRSLTAPVTIGSEDGVGATETKRKAATSAKP